MPKKSSTLETTVIALELLRCISRTHKVTTRELMTHLDGMGIRRDVRTIQRLMQSLCEHFEIDCDDRSTPYGYQWKLQAKTFSLPSLSNQESLLLALAEKQMSPLLPPAVMKTMEGFFKQARANLAPLIDNAQLEKQWLKKVRVVSETQPLLPPKIVDGVLEAVSQALYLNQYLDIGYSNAKGEQKQHRIMPLGLAQQGPRLYLVCRYEGYDNERILAVHRIRQASVTGLEFVRPKFDLEQYELDGSFGVGNGERVQLSFVIEKGAGLHLLESPLSKDQVATEIDGGYRIEATVVKSMLLERWLRGFGGQVSEIEMTSIVSRVEKRFANLL